MIVAIHQPNYLPWLAYFHKIARADLFVFLDNVQFSKSGYCNRVHVLLDGRRRWLTVPVSFAFGDSIDMVQLAQEDWTRRHLDALREYYRKAACFNSAYHDLDELYRDMPTADLAAANRYLVEQIAVRLGLSCRYMAASDFDADNTRGDERLIQIVETAAPGGMYLSGAGGAKYQDESKFATAGLTVTYSRFDHPEYDQNGREFVPGLSVIDAVFHLGWEETGRLVSGDSV